MEGKTNILENPQLELAYSFVQYTNRNIFLTGKAGTGKTTFLHNLKRDTPKRMVVVAPTGVAAINAGGVTIHSFFQLPFGPLIPSEDDDEKTGGFRQNVQKFSKEKINIIKSLDLLVIDEISMVRADLLDGIDSVLRRFKDKSKAFGGVQLLMIGDIQQLAPVVKENEWELLRPWYTNAYFFNSRALMRTKYVSIELKHIYRQSDRVFVELLNKVRENKVNAETLDELNKRYDPEAASKTPEGYIILTSHNHQAQSINDRKINQIESKAYKYLAEVNGNFPDYAYPADNELTLKKGAQVMFIKNDPSPAKLFYNGKIGVVERIDDESISVKCAEDSHSITVIKAEWQNSKYTINEVSGEIEESIEGTFTQYPLKLAWAITIHKSQGLTFEKAIINANASFAHGQVYVALSRCKTLEGMILSSKLSIECIKSDTEVVGFSREIESNQPDAEVLEQAKYEYQQSLVFELFDFNEIKGHILHSLRIYAQNMESLHSGLKDTLEKILNTAIVPLAETADKFKPQIIQMLKLQPDIEKNVQLNERIIKACNYFEDKVRNDVFKALQDIKVECDNKSVKKSLDGVIGKAITAVFMKADCFAKCKDGFNIKSYLDTRAKSYIENSSVRKPPVVNYQESSGDYLMHPELFAMLKEWRAEKAADMGQPCFVVLHQKTLIQIIETLPSDLKQLRTIKGIGKQKAKAFGKEILDLVERFCRENKIGRELPQGNADNKDIKRNESKKIGKQIGKQMEQLPHTRTISFDMYKKGMTVPEIAAARGLATSTIEGHLAEYVSKGQIAISEFLDKEKLDIIIKAFKKHGTAQMAPVKEELGDDFSYGDLRLAKAYLSFLEKDNARDDFSPYMLL